MLPILVEKFWKCCQISRLSCLYKIEANYCPVKSAALLAIILVRFSHGPKTCCRSDRLGGIQAANKEEAPPLLLLAKR
jgi:hypothetical protein